MDELSESPRDRAYRHFLLWQCGELAKEVRVLFDPDSLASRLFPRPKVLRQLIERLGADDLQGAWKPGNEETIGWVYQFFIADEKAAAFKKVFKDKKKFSKDDVPAATQVFTPRWIVKFLVQNSLGRLWLSMHPDSALATSWEYFVLPAGAPPATPTKSAKEVRLLDPATGTMHFGLVAFDLLVGMYREEIANAGKEGWPKEPSVSRDEDIPASILANNLFGIDIDLRAVQLSALALYVRAKAHHHDAVLTESRLACADVALFRGAHRNRIANEMSLPHGLSRHLFGRFCESLDEASMMGSLVRLERIFEENLLADELKIAIDEYVRRKAAQGIDESYFASESSKGLRLLDFLLRRYDVVFTNPPYMSNRNMNPEMSAFMKNNYRKSKGDLYSGFIERCSELLDEQGRMAMITQQSFMFISSYEDLRQLLVSSIAIETMAHVGPRAFDEVQGGKVNTTAFVLRRERTGEIRRDSVGVYFRLVKEPDAEAKRVAFEQALDRRNQNEPDSRVCEYHQGDFAAIPGSPWVYWIMRTLRQLFVELPKLEHYAKPCVGINTNDNVRFLRRWWELGTERVRRRCNNREDARSSGNRWFPYMKGGESKPWWGNQELIVNWKDDGEEIKAWAVIRNDGQHWSRYVRSIDKMFRRGVTWTDVTGGRFAARLSPGGFVFDVKGSSAFPEDIPLVLGLLNSSFANYTLNLINPTASYQVGDLARLPVPTHCSGPLRNLVEEAVLIAKTDSESDESAYDFIAPVNWTNGIESVRLRHGRLSQIKCELDHEVYRLYQISDEDRQVIEDELASPKESEDGGDADSEAVDVTVQGSIARSALAAQWMQYAVGIALSRFHPGVAGALGSGSFEPVIAATLRDLSDKDGILVLEEGHPSDLARRALDVLSAICGDDETERIVRAATESTEPLRTAVETYLAGEFFRDHVRRYRKRPVYWLIQSPKKSYSLYLFHEKATADTLSLLRGNRYLGGRINRLQQEQTNLRAAIARGDRGASTKAGRIAELLEELQEFDRRLEAATRVSAKDKHDHDVTVRWEPELDDGVYINAAPLHELLPSWRDVNPKKAWQELAEGEYDWSRTAMRRWPQRVLAKCKDDKSYAIAHGLV